jgi:hypothetical protein
MFYFPHWEIFYQTINPRFKFIKRQITFCYITPQLVERPLNKSYDDVANSLLHSHLTNILLRGGKLQ